MTSLAPPIGRSRWWAPAAFALLILITAVTVAVRSQSRSIFVVTLVAALLLLAGSRVLQWRTLIASMTLVILFIPIRRLLASRFAAHQPRALPLDRGGGGGACGWGRRLSTRECAYAAAV